MLLNPLRIAARLTAVALLAALLSAPLARPADAVTKNKIANAWVPSLCGHPAGRLDDGRHSKVPEYVWVKGMSQWDDPATMKWIVRGRLTRSSTLWGAAVVFCYQGGVAWPENVVFYNARGEYVGVRRLGNLTKGGREVVRRIWISDRRVHVQIVNINQGDEPGCCGTKSAKAVFAWNGAKKRIVTKRLRTYTEKPFARRLATRVNAGKRAAARKIASRSVVRKMFGWRSRGYRFSYSSCFGMYDDWWGEELGTSQRGCELRASKPTTERLFVLGMKQATWRTWKASRVIYP